MGDFNEYPSSSEVAGPQGPQGEQGPQGPQGPQGETGPAIDQLLQDIFNWTGSQNIPTGTFQNYFSLAGIAKDAGGTAGLSISSGLMMFPAKTKLSQVLFSVRISGTIGGTSGTAREWFTQTRRPDGTTVVGSDLGVKITGSDISNRDSTLVSFTKDQNDPFTINGIQLGMSNVSTQTITLTSVSVRIQRVINPEPA